MLNKKIPNPLTSIPIAIDTVSIKFTIKYDFSRFLYCDKIALHVFWVIVIVIKIGIVFII
jgi:hypothetical protein